MAIKMAVIDTGVSFSLLPEDILVARYISLKQKEDNNENGIIEILEGIDYGDSIEGSHGTKVVNTIKKYAPDVEMEFYLYDVFHKSATSSGAIIIEALNDILKYDIDIIVMSLICSPKYREEFMQLKDSILKKNVIFICSASNAGSNDFPANLDFIFGVGGGYGENGKFNYYPRRKIQFCCNTEYEFVVSGNKVQIFGGTSKAAATVAGLLADYTSQNGKIALRNYLKCKHIMSKDKKIYGAMKKEDSTDIFDKIIDVFDLEKFQVTDDLLYKPIAWNRKNIENLVCLFEKFQCIDSMQKIEYSDFKSLYALVRYFENVGKGK